LNIKNYNTVNSCSLWIDHLWIYPSTTNFCDNTKFTESQVYVYVPTDANYSEVKKLLAPYIDNLERFDMVANKMSYPQNVKSGRFY
jgi:hypothetical protein